MSTAEIAPAIRFTTRPFMIAQFTVLLLPEEASAGLPSRGQVMVVGTINGIEFQAPLEPDGRGSHWLQVGKALQRVAGVKAGESAALSITPTKAWPEPVVPADVRVVLADSPQTRPLWQAVTPMARWEWLRWIGSTAQAETRRRRIEVARSKLLAGERRPCCFNRNVCCIPEVSKNGVLLAPDTQKGRG